MNKILVVDDEKEIVDLVELYLKNENYTVYKYYSAKEVLDNIDNLDVDLAILDVMMPEIDGFMLCNKIREKYTFPIIFATAKVEEIDKIKEELNNIGITSSVVYPDFTGLAEEIKKPHKFISNNELILNESDHFLPIPLDN